VGASAPGARRPLLIAEDHRNLAHMLRPRERGGWGLDAVWADDFHHQVRRAVAGDREGYYADFEGSTADLCTTLRRGWFFCGQRSRHRNEARGTDPSGIAPRRFVVCLQNHDQVGNRAFGDRLHHTVDAAAFRAATVLLLCAPQTPLLFMGQEWGASSPFLYFTDHRADLGKLVTRGRRREFKAFSAFAGAEAREGIPDPQAAATFAASRLDWKETRGRAGAAERRLRAGRSPSGASHSQRLLRSPRACRRAFSAFSTGC
jgi:maltooligosyltrehalose trehalohydrolase